MVHLAKEFFLSFSIALHWLSNIMLNLLTKRFFDISLLFKLKYAAISLMLWTVNKSCCNDSLCLYEYTKMIGFKKKRHSRKIISTFQRNRHFRKVSVNKTFTHVQEQKKRFRRDIPLAFRLA